MKNCCTCTNTYLIFLMRIQLCTSIGFREKHSTQQVIISIVKKITKSWDTGDIVIGVFLDLKRAFDTDSHDIFLKKMYVYGIRGNAFKLLKSYLTGRTQYVIYDGVQSATYL